MIKAVTDAGYDYITMDAELTRYGGIETRDEGLLYAKWLKEREGKYDEIPNIDVMYEGYFSVVPYVIPGKYVAYAFSYTGGALMQWCAENLTKKEMEDAAADGIVSAEICQPKLDMRLKITFDAKALN